jgi:REP element-mobilizing transposase RayT
MGFKYAIRNDGLYFLTFATVDWVDVFTRKELADVIIESLKYCQKEKGLQIFAWCLMPSHIHLLASAGMNGDLSAIMRDFKKFTSKKVIETIKEIPDSRREWMLDRFEFAGRFDKRITNYKFWQEGTHPMEIFSDKFIKQKLVYIHQNPVKAGIVWEAWQYQFSSAIDYYGKGKGLLDVEYLGAITL